MGDIAEMILEGILCEDCGCYIEDEEAEGYPRKCNDCKKNQ
jgi:methionyl-tRNA synthetase